MIILLLSPDLYRRIFGDPSSIFECLRTCLLQRSNIFSINCEHKTNANYLRWSDRVNFFWHTAQVNRFSPVCVRMCRASSSDLANLLSHSGHVHPNGRSPFKWQQQQQNFDMSSFSCQFKPKTYTYPCVFSYELWDENSCHKSSDKPDRNNGVICHPSLQQDLKGRKAF